MSKNSLVSVYFALASGFQGSAQLGKAFQQGCENPSGQLFFCGRWVGQIERNIAHRTLPLGKVTRDSCPGLDERSSISRDELLY